MTAVSAFRRVLLGATSLTVLGLAAPALAETTGAPVRALDVAAANTAGGPDFVEDVTAIVINENYNNNASGPGGALDSGITGVGQMVTRPNPNTFGVGLCTGTLINPRTVIFAAHCVNTIPAAGYGSASGGRPISFGFQADNLNAVRTWLGIFNPADLYKTNTAQALYNVENVWYDPRSLALGAANNFLQADVAIATLDTPAFDIPTWTLLFSPLTGEVPVTITGYGGSSTNPNLGANQGIDFRRRIAENVLSFAGSLNDRNLALFGTNAGLPQTLYSLDFDSPDGTTDFQAGTPGFDYDFDLFDGPARPREGTTAGGDSGGPLIIESSVFGKPTVAGVLSGGSRFFGAQPFSSYGTQSFYQPLFLFWDKIVENNPYVYATNIAGVRQWTDPTHWAQEMDPAYQVIRDGELVNALPGALGAGVSGATTKFGSVCFLASCVQFQNDGNEDPGTGAGLVIAGGPGSTGFVPNNVKANPVAGIKPRYYDVTLAASGATKLDGASITIDRLTIDGAHTLEVGTTGSLRVLGDFTQIAGWTNVNGSLTTGEAFLLSGVLAGSGTFKAPFVTTAAVAIAPGGGDRFGTLTIDGNLITTSGSALYIDASRNGADLLAVTGRLSLSDPNDPASVGPALVFSKSGPAPRHGQSFTIVTAGGGIEGAFGRVLSFQGVLRPELTYGADFIRAELRAGALVDMIGNEPTAKAFAQALDALRDGSYSALYNLYGHVDLLDSAALTRTLGNLAPRFGGASDLLQQRQSEKLFTAVSDRLSMAGSRGNGSLSVIGNAGGVAQILAAGTNGGDAALRFAGLAPSSERALALPEGMTGFVSSGVIGGASGDNFGVTGGVQRGYYFGTGMERTVDERLMVGVAVGYAAGTALDGRAENRTETRQIAAYASYDLGRGAYVGGIASLDEFETQRDRLGVGATAGERLYGASESAKLGLTAEAGLNLAVGRDLTLTPRAQLAYSRHDLAGFSEFGGNAALAVDSLTIERLEARVGARIAGRQVAVSGWTITPDLRADYVNAVAGGNSGLTVRFAAADHLAIALPLANGDTSWGEVRGGVTVDNGTFSFGAGVETSIGRAALRDDRAMINATARF